MFIITPTENNRVKSIGLAPDADPEAVAAELLGDAPYLVLQELLGAPDDLRWNNGVLAVVSSEPPIPDPKRVGVLFQGVMCSATAADQNGLVAVLMAIQVQGAEFKPTRFEFDNGNSLVITLANYEAFMAVWLPFRQSFFAVTP